MEEYFKRIQQIICEKTGLEFDEVKPDSYFEDDLNMGPMELVDLLTDLEEIYQVEELILEKDNLETIQDVIDLLIEKVE